MDEWRRILNENIAQCVQTLDRERMKMEVIFREIIDGNKFLYWVSIQGEGGKTVETSPFEIDRIHREFMEKCIDHDYGRKEAQPQVIIIPEIVARSMNWEEPATASIAFQRRDIIFKRANK